jgi:integrase
MAMSPGEVFALRWEDYDGKDVSIYWGVYRGVVDEPKTEASRDVLPVPAILRDALETYGAG